MAVSGLASLSWIAFVSESVCYDRQILFLAHISCLSPPYEKNMEAYYGRIATLFLKCAGRICTQKGMQTRLEFVYGQS